MPVLRFAMVGTGFWARYQLAGWRELKGARCVALYNRTRAKGEALAAEFNVPRVYDDAAAMFRDVEADFVDIVTDVGTHAGFTRLAAARRLPVICQKPMARTLAEARSMIAAARTAGVPLYIHENWRWQRPIREVKRVLDSGIIGKVFRARIDYCNSFPVFENQPFLKELEQFILTDMGTHIFDVGRFLFGEAERLYCQVHRVRADIKGEDAATVVMRLTGGATLTCNLSYSSPVEHDRFPEAFIFVEGDTGSIELAPDYWVRVTTRRGTHARRCPPAYFPWADPRYALVHASIVDCHRNLLSALQGAAKAETTAEDNLRTLQLVFSAYKSASTGKTVVLSGASERDTNSL